jgi:hypothetical protein
MSVRAEINKLTREIRIPSVNGECPGVAQFIHLITESDPLPEPSLCPLCDKQHWPAPQVQRICIVQVCRSYGPPAEVHA